MQTSEVRALFALNSSESIVVIRGWETSGEFGVLNGLALMKKKSSKHNPSPAKFLEEIRRKRLADGFLSDEDIKRIRKKLGFTLPVKRLRRDEGLNEREQIT